MDAAALAALRPIERRERVLQRLRDDRGRLLRDARPVDLACFASTTAGGLVAVAPLQPGDAVQARPRRLAEALAGAVAVAAGLDAPRDGADLAVEGATWAGFLALRLTTLDAGGALDLLELALAEQAEALDRVAPLAVPLPAGMLEQTEPATFGWLWRAEVSARIGGQPAATRLADEVEAALAALGPTRPPGALEDDATDAHGDALPPRRVVRRILRRLDGMGKYGGYHTEFSHLARGFAGHERNLALEAGEVLLRAGLLDEKPSVGQRHVALVAARTAEIRLLVERGETDDPELRTFFARRA